MDKAKADGKAIVYVGFGSITVPRPNHVTSHIIKAVLKSMASDHFDTIGSIDPSARRCPGYYFEGMVCEDEQVDRT